MELSIRLAQIMEEHSDAGRGAIKRICDATGLERHAVAAIFHNDVKYVSLKNLGAICDFLIDQLNVDPALLPGILFGHEPTAFWERLAVRDRLEISVGARGSGEEQQVSSSDLHLQGEVVRRVMEGRRIAERPPQRPLVQTLVTAPPRVNDPDRVAVEEAGRKEAIRAYREFEEHRASNGALVCLGSVKSNPLIEMVVASAFGLVPFRRVSANDDGACPVYVRFRDGDVHPPSCFGGVEAPALPADGGVADGAPGIYYMAEPGVWSCAPVDDRHDAALVFFVHRPSTGRLEMVMGGYTAQATNTMVRLLSMFNDEAYEPAVDEGSCVSAMVVIRFVRDADARESAAESIAIDGDVLGKRLAG